MPTNNVSSSSSSTGGIGFLGLLTILFIALKLIPNPVGEGHIIDWSWLWVLSPLWIGALLSTVVILLVLVGVIIKVASK